MSETPPLRPILNTAVVLREQVRSKVSNAITTMFPLDLKGRTLEIKDVQVHPQDYSPDAQRHALLSGGTLHEPVTGTLILKDATGKVIDEAKKFTLAKIPYFTERHTIILGGNEYQVANQLRRRPGVYTQRSSNGEISTLFNLSKGRNITMQMVPETGVFHITPVDSSVKVPLYPVLRALGVPHTDIAKHWTPGVADANREHHGDQEEAAIDKLYKKLLHPTMIKPGATHAEKIEAVRAKFDMTAMDGKVTGLTLGQEFDKVTPVALLHAGKKLLSVHEGKSEVDDSDSLAYKTFHSVDDFFAERLKLFSRAWKMKVKQRFTGKDKVRDALAPQPFTDTLRKFITSSTLTAVPTGINPLEIIDHAVKVTSLGEGGISEERAIPYDARLVHATHYGILDPVKTPECYDEKTEVFTSKGWKFWPDITAEDALACRVDGRLEFHKPLRLIRQPYKGLLYGLRTGKLSYLVTPNHRVLDAPVDAVYPVVRENAWRIERADAMHGRPRVFDTGHAPYVGASSKFFWLPKVKSLPKASPGGQLKDNVANVPVVEMEDWAAFLGWYLAEGNTTHKSPHYRVHVAQSRVANPENCAQIEALLARLPFTWSPCEDGTGYDVYGKQLAAYLKQFGYCDDKFIPEVFFEAAQAVRENLLETLMLGDGRIDSVRANGRRYRQEVFCTSSAQLAADVERLAISLGRAVSVRRYADKRAERYLDMYEVRLLQQRYRQAVPRRGHYYTQQHDGLVYCAEVPGGLLYVRRDNAVGMWSGNSGAAGIDIRATIGAHRDEQGNLYTTVRNVKTGKTEHLPAGDIMRHTIAFPGQELKGTIDAMVKGRVEKVPAGQATYQYLHNGYAFSPATNLVPLLYNIQGNRAIMGSKHVTQALPLVEREAPLVQVMSHDGKHSYEQLITKQIVPTAPVAGTVERVEGGHIYIRPHAEKKSALLPEVQRYFDKVAAEQGLPAATEWLHRMQDDAKSRGYSIFAVVEDPTHPHGGGSITTVLPGHKGDAVRNARAAHVQWELENGHDPNHDWRKTASDKTKKLGPLTFKIDRPKGFVKTWEDSGKSWTYPVDYGYFPKLDGEDGEALDAFVGDDPKGVMMSFLKLKYDDLTGKMTPDETKFLLGVTEKERDTILKFYGDEVSAKTTYDDFDAVKEALKRFIGTKKPRYEKTASEKVADRPIKTKKAFGPFTFDIELKKGSKPFGHTFLNDYGYLAGYHGPDGDSLDFWVGDDPKGALVSVDTKEVGKDGKFHKADVKFMVGIPKSEIAGQIAQIEQKPDTKAYNRKEYADWDELTKAIERYKDSDEEKAAAHKDDTDLVKVPYLHDFPFPSKTYLHHDIKVKAGDKVEAGQRLADSNFTQNDTLALGKNLRVAYMAYHGMNSNDAVVISEGCAKKLTSEHMYREVYPVSGNVEFNTAKHKAYFAAKHPASAYEALDEHGIVRKGATVQPKDLLVAALVPSAPSATDLMLGKISKSLIKPYQDSSLDWHHGFPGEVVEVVRTPGQIAILVKTREPMQIGDKLSGQHGNKGVVSLIVPDHEMVHDEEKRPVDVIMTSAGIVSRINPAQVLTGALGKVAEKIGKPIMVRNDAGIDQTKFVSDLMAKHGVKDKEILYDPKLGRHIKGPDGKGVFVGRTYIFKLFKSTDVNFAAHGVGPYDINEQPSRPGGEEAPKAFGKMEFDALVAHNARNVIKEAGTFRSQKNEEFWRAIQLGHPLPTAKPSFIYNKFVAMLEGAGVKVDKRGSKLKLLPMTDKDILARSTGAITSNKTLIAKNLQPEKGGLFDPNLTGGPQGTQYAHVALHESVPNPIFENPIRALLGMTTKQFDATLRAAGGDHFRKELAKIDVPTTIKQIRTEIPSLKGSDLDHAVKKVKYLEALHKEGLKPQDAYVLKHVPIVPPVFRPIVRQPNDPTQLTVSDANKLYIHLFDANTTLKDTVLESDRGKHREKLYTAVGAVFGTHEPDDEELRGQRVKGFLSAIAGVGSPKNGFFQKKILSRMMDVSGRGTAVPDPNLNMDQVGLPEEMLWKMLEKFVIARLVRNGYPAVQAQDMVAKRSSGAQEALRQELKERPVMVNRAPTLHRWGIIGAYAVPVQGKTIRVSPFIEKGLNLDYDGDTLQIHAPITPGGIQDTRKMLLSNQVLSDQSRNKLLAFPQHEAIIGVVHAAEQTAKGAVKKFKTHDDLLRAYRKGEVALTDNVEVTG